MNVNTSLPPNLNERTYTEPPDNRARINGLTMLTTELGVMIGYGLSGSFKNSTGGYSILRGDIILLILMFLFVLVGFGLLLNTFRYGSWLGSAAAILLVAISVQLGPLMQKLWIGIILTSFGQANTDVGSTPITSFWNNTTSTLVDVGPNLIRIALLTVISGMVVMSSTIGRVSVMQIVKFASFYHIFWGINYFLLIYMNVIYQDHNDAAYYPYFFDMFGTTYVYLFAVFFGLPYSLLMKRQYLPEIHPRNEFNRLSLLLSQIGAGFIIALFVFTSTTLVNYNFYGNAVGSNISRFSILFGLIGSIIGTFIGSALVGKGRVGYKEVLTGTISGGVIMGAAAPLITNIGILIMIGGVSGFFGGIYMRVAHVNVNKNIVRDVLGLFGPFCIASILGSLVVVPATLQVYYVRSIAFPFSTATVPMPLIGYQLIYVGISAGIGLVGGLIVALFGLCDRDYFALASNSRLFLNDFGLHDLGEVSKSQQTFLPAGLIRNPLNTPGMQGPDSQQVLNRTGALV